MIKGLRYFSVAVRDLDEALGIYRDMLGMKQRTDVRQTQWGFENIMVGDDEKNMVELIHVTDPNSALARFMNSRKNKDNPEGEGLYLVSLEVDDLAKAVADIRAKGGRVIDQGTPNTAWVHPLSTRMAFLELYEAPKDAAQPPAGAAETPAARRPARRAPARSASKPTASAKRTTTRASAAKKPAKPATRRTKARG